MATSNEIIDFDKLRKAWSLLKEYHEFRRTVCFRKKLEEQLRDASVPLIHVPRKSMARALLCRSMFNDEQLAEMNAHTAECYTSVDFASSEAAMNLLLENKQEDEDNLTETWFEVDDLKKRFQRAMDVMSTSRLAHKELWHRILGYSFVVDYDGNENDDKPLDLARVLTIGEQNQMRTGDVMIGCVKRVSRKLFLCLKYD